MAKHIHIHFAPRKRIGDQAPGSVPPSDLTPLVEALHAAIAARQGTPTQDAGFDESKVKRDEGGRFSAQQHMHAAAKHHEEADTHKAAGNTKASKAHTEAAMEHEMAAQHIKAGTGWAEHRSQSAHNKSAEAAKLSAGGPANIDQLKAQASDPKAPIEQRAAAVKQLAQMEKMANEVAASPHAVPAKPEVAVPGTMSDPAMQALAAKNPDLAKQINEYNQSGRVFRTDPNHSSQKMRPAGLPPEPGHGQPSSRQAAAALEASKETNTGLPPKPTKATASGAKAATHELLSSGHPFSVDELMTATGVTNKTTLMTALSDLKSPKYAGKLGALNIVKRPDGMYHVQKDDGKPLGKVAVGGTQIKPMPAQGTGFKPAITSPMGPGNPLAGVGPDTPKARTRAELDAEMAPGAPGRLKPGGKHDMVTMANEQTDAYVKGGPGLNPYAKDSLQYKQVEARRAEYAATAPKPTIESLQQQILAANQAVPGNTAAAAAKRMKVIGPLNRQIAALRAQDPSTLEGHLAQSKVGPDGSVTHNGASVGKIEKKIIPGFKRVNGAPQMTYKEAYKVTHASGADLGHAGTLKDAHTRLMQHHMKQPGTSSGPTTSASRSEAYLKPFTPGKA